MPNPKGVRQASRVLLAGSPNRNVEGISKEVIPGIRLDRNVAIPVVGLQRDLELLGIEALGTVDD